MDGIRQTNDPSGMRKPTFRIRRPEIQPKKGPGRGLSGIKSPGNQGSPPRFPDKKTVLTWQA
ncbi:hypothetical protein Abiwalacus_00480 [Akkermansia biwaensis]|uniref:Uncharacterized protein n=1 Tax=Akkermansia biwaensis TaxID=2946555 RepID=A0ABM7ZCR8_9BACT|nr:hypothetical protein Abiwalacus_00480 [Akkermansia biwaensis]